MHRIAVFSNDAGSSELLLELIIASSHIGIFEIFCLKHSPCHKLAISKKLSNHVTIISKQKNEIYEDLDRFNPSLILYGTGWQNHIEYFFLDYAKEKNLTSVAFLDHWTNYLERFGYPQKDWKNNLPDFIAAHDELSESRAKSLSLPNVVGIKNYFFAKQKEEEKRLEKKFANHKPTTLLFLSEPTAKVAKTTFGDEYYWGFTEKEIYQNIIAHKRKFHCEDIRVRLHPSDTKECYEKIDPHTVFSDTSLLEDIANAKVIVGIDTIALYLAYLIGKPVISYIPSSSREHSIPIPEKNRFENLNDCHLDKLEILTSNPTSSYGMDFALFLQKISEEQCNQPSTVLSSEREA